MVIHSHHTMSPGRRRTRRRSPLRSAVFLTRLLTIRRFASVRPSSGGDRGVVLTPRGRESQLGPTIRRVRGTTLRMAAESLDGETNPLRSEADPLQSLHSTILTSLARRSRLPELHATSEVRSVCPTSQRSCHSLPQRPRTLSYVSLGSPSMWRA